MLLDYIKNSCDFSFVQILLLGGMISKPIQG